MFDFAPTGKPMLFFTYDLEDYRDNLRGFYFDFEAEVPGPLLATSPRSWRPRRPGRGGGAVPGLQAFTARSSARWTTARRARAPATRIFGG